MLHQASSDFGNYRVAEMTYNDRPARLLFGDDKSPQSGIALDNDPELLFDYNQRFMEIAFSMQPKRILVIGGGAFSLPVALASRLQAAVIDVVEIDPLLPELARQYFNLKDQPINIFVDDGRNFLEKNNTKYDLIIVDAFSGLDIPRSLLSVAAIKLYNAALLPAGLVTINLISAFHTPKPQLAHQLIETFKTAFKQIKIYPADHYANLAVSDNLILTASHKPLDLPYLQAVSLTNKKPLSADIIYD